MHALIRTLKGIDLAVALLEKIFAFVATIAMLLLVVIPVVLRALLDVWDGAARLLADSVWMGPVARFLLLWTALVGASLATRLRRHIAIDVVTKSLPPRARASVGALGSLVAAAVCAVIARVGAFVAAENWTQPTPLRGVNLGPVQIIIPIALSIMTYRFLIAALEDTRGAATGDLAYLHEYEAAGAHHGEHPASVAPREKPIDDGTAGKPLPGAPAP